MPRGSTQELCHGVPHKIYVLEKNLKYLLVTLPCDIVHVCLVPLPPQKSVMRISNKYLSAGRLWNRWCSKCGHFWRHVASNLGRSGANAPLPALASFKHIWLQRVHCECMRVLMRAICCGGTPPVTRHRWNYVCIVLHKQGLIPLHAVNTHKELK